MILCMCVLLKHLITFGSQFISWSLVVHNRLSVVTEQNQVIDGRCCGLDVLSRDKMAVQDDVDGVFNARCEGIKGFNLVKNNES